MMLLDMLADLVDERLPVHSRELRAVAHVSLRVAPDPQRPGSPMVAAEFIFAAPSPLLGEVMWHIALERGEIAFDPDAIDRLVLNCCEQLRETKAKLLSATASQP
jgi:hypothetical protein